MTRTAPPSTSGSSPPTTPTTGGGRRRAHALPAGCMLDEYRIDAILGAGGFGVTYRAFDTHLENWVAIKEYFPLEWSYRDADGVSVQANTQGMNAAADGKGSDYQWGLERFLDEARVLARVQHPYVVRIKRYFKAHGTAYIVMDYEEGQPLSAILRDGETLGEQDIRGLLEDVLPALQAVHEQGFLHRDIKPANLYVRKSDHRVLLIDFGAARAAIGQHSRSVTSLITPGYSPPEQYTTRNDRYGTWTDLYALGAVLYRCVAGHPPAEAAERLLDDTLVPARQVGAGRYSSNLLRVIDRVLAVRTELRFGTVAEMQAALNGEEEGGDETVILVPSRARVDPPTQSRLAPAGSENWMSDVTRPGLPTRSAMATPVPMQPQSQRTRFMVLGGVLGIALLVIVLVGLWPSAPPLQQPVPVPVPALSTTPAPPSAATLPASETLPATVPPPAPPPAVAEEAPQSVAPAGISQPAPGWGAAPESTPPPETGIAPPAEALPATEVPAQALPAPEVPAVPGENAASDEPPAATDADSPDLAPAVPVAATAAAAAAAASKSRNAVSAPPAKKAPVPAAGAGKSGSPPRKRASRARGKSAPPAPTAPVAAPAPAPAPPRTFNPWDAPASSGFNQK